MALDTLGMVQMNGNTLFQGEKIPKYWKFINDVKKSPFFQRQQANFNKTWHKASFGYGLWGFKYMYLQMKGHGLFQGNILTKYWKKHWRLSKIFKTTGPISTKLGSKLVLTGINNDFFHLPKRLCPWFHDIQLPIVYTLQFINFFKIKELCWPLDIFVQLEKYTFEE